MNTLIRYLLLLVLFTSIQVELFAQPTFFVAGGEFEENEQFCVDVTVEDFTDLIGLQFTMSWDPNVLSYRNTQNHAEELDLDDSPAFFGDTETDAGILRFSWSSADGVSVFSLGDGQILFSLCFEVIGQAGQSSSVRFTDDPLDREALDASVNSINIDTNDSEIEIIGPSDSGPVLDLYYDDIIITQESFCLPIRVNNFVDIGGVQFSLLFNFSKLRYIGVENLESWGGSALALTNDILSNTNGQFGYLAIPFSEDALELDDGDALFDLCFELIEEESCFLEELILGEEPVEITAFRLSDEQEIEINFMPGQISLFVGEPLVIADSSIIDVTCDALDSGSIELDVVGGNIAPKYLWSDGSTSASISNLSPGNYSVTITDECLAVDSVKASFNINIDGEVPTANAGPDQDIPCSTNNVILDGSNSSSGTDVTYTWRGINGQVIDQGASTNRATVSREGFYELIVTNTSSGCTALDTVIVTDGRIVPDVEAGEGGLLDCDNATVTLMGNGSMGNNFSYQWSTTDGNILTAPSDQNITVDLAGTYTLTIRNTDTGCADTDVATVTGNGTKPLANISGGTIITCANDEITLNANNGGNGESDVSYSWTTSDGQIISGADEVNATVNQGGTYNVVAIHNLSTCEDNATLLVMEETSEPVITASGGRTIDCSDEQTTLNVDIESNNNFNIEWNRIAGEGTIVADGNDMEPTVEGFGTFEVRVTNPMNGCFSTEAVTIELNGDLLLATAGDDYESCETEIILFGNTDVGLTGQWTVVEGAAELEDPDDPGSRVNSLSTGSNTFVWTLSSGNCGAYSSDTISVTLRSDLELSDDSYDVTQDFISLDMDLLANDDIQGNQNPMITIIENPSIGEIVELGDGQFRYSISDPDVFGVFDFTYEVCDEICPLICDQARVEVDVREVSAPTPIDTAAVVETQSLGITPNGDGLNDFLVFKELLDGKEYKTQRLLIYNRWGDILVEQRPYQNDWDGTVQGKPLPQGTYYYILQLDIGQGLIKEGDVTILRK